MFSQSLVENSLMTSMFPKGKILSLFMIQEIPASFACPGIFNVTLQRWSVGILLVLVSSPQMNEQEFQKGLTLEKSFPLCNRLVFQDFPENPEKRINSFPIFTCH